MTRETLPDRRSNVVLETAFQGMFYTVEFGVFPGAPARVAEVFISCTKNTSTQASIARDAAILISLALQHGAALETLRKGVTRNDPVSDMTRVHDETHVAASIAGHALDVVAHALIETSGQAAAHAAGSAAIAAASASDVRDAAAQDAKE